MELSLSDCADCGEPAPSDLCDRCVKVANALGWSQPARLAALGVLPIFGGDET